MSSALTFEDSLRAIVRDVVREEIRNALMEHHGRTQGRNDHTVGGYLSLAKAAELADVAPGTLRRWIRAGRLPTLRAGRVYRVGRAELIDFLRREGRSEEIVARARAIVAAPA